MLDSPGDNSSGSWNGYLLYKASLGNILMLGGPVVTSWPSNPVLSSPDAYNLDKKMDDGDPMRGILVAGATTACDGMANGGASSGAYVLSTTTPACFIYFPYAF